MHAHHKKLLRDFWLISPGKPPTGKTSQRGEIFNFFSKIMDRNTTYLHHRFLHKIWKFVLSKYTSLTPSISVLIKCIRTAIKDSRTVPRILCYLLTCRTAINVTVPSSKSVQELMQRTAGNTPRNSCRN